LQVSRDSHIHTRASLLLWCTTVQDFETIKGAHTDEVSWVPRSETGERDDTVFCGFALVLSRKVKEVGHHRRLDDSRTLSLVLRARVCARGGVRGIGE
jgi:hypothetical protein